MATKIKAQRGLLLSLITLLFAIALTTTSTYAWFAMNESVTATGMSVTARTESTYLVISNSSTLGTETTVNLSSVTGTLVPTAYTTSAIRNSTDTADLVAANKWYTAAGTNTTNGAAKTDSKTQLTIAEADNLGAVDGKNYYVYKSVWLGLTAGSAAVSQGVQADVTFNATQSSNFNKGLTVKIVYGGGSPSSATTTQTYNYGAATGSVTQHAQALQSASLITETATEVKIYIYFDGEDASCTTANAINLDSITIDVTFYVNATLRS